MSKRRISDYPRAQTLEIFEGIECVQKIAADQIWNSFFKNMANRFDHLDIQYVSAKDYVAYLSPPCLSNNFQQKSLRIETMAPAGILSLSLVALLAVSKTSGSFQSANETRHLLDDEHRNQKHLLSHAEKLAELYYQNQLRERTKSLTYNAFIHLNPNYPCLHGVVPIGADTVDSIKDGHKFSCGIQHIKSSPIVYSFGSNKQQDFEQSMLYYRPDSRVYTHDILESHLPDMSVRDPKITYYATALGPSSSAKSVRSNEKIQFKLLHELMKERGHTYIDVLKIDIEGGEYPWVVNEPLDTFDRIGQLMIEVHRQGHGKLLVNV